MKMVATLALGVFLLTGCSEELKESKVKSKKVAEKVEQIQKEATKKPYVAEKYVQKPLPQKNQPLTEKESEYINVVGTSIDVYDENVNEISRLIKEAQANPSLMADTKWKSEIEGYFLSITNQLGIFLIIENLDKVPERFEELHEYTRNTFNFMSMAGRKMTQGIENGLDKSLIGESTDLINKSNEELDKVTVEIQRITEEIS